MGRSHQSGVSLLQSPKASELNCLNALQQTVGHVLTSLLQEQVLPTAGSHLCPATTASPPDHICSPLPALEGHANLQLPRAKLHIYI